MSSSSWTPSDDDISPSSLNADLNSSAAVNSRGNIDPIITDDPIEVQPYPEQTSSEHHEVSIGQKRPYRHITRPHRQVKPNYRPRKTIWMDALETTTLAKLRRQKCCKALRCFAHVDYEFFTDTASRLFTASTSTRRTVLNSFLGSDKVFRFNGRVVCVVFLKDGFHFSTVLIAEVASGRIKRPVRSHHQSPSQLQSAQSVNSSLPSSASTTADSTSDASQIKKKEAIISFVERVAEDCGDSMPHKAEVHLPFHQIQEVFPVFQREFEQLYPGIEPVTKAYFRRTWLINCPNIKVVKSSRFAKCETCESIRRQLRDRINAGHSTTDIKMRRKSHLSFVSSERLEYQKKKDRARLHSDENCSVIIDGADESAFGLPHFTTKSKAQKGHAMKVKVVGLLEHRMQNRLELYTMTQEHQTGANHVVEVLHRFLCAKRQEGKLPPKLFIQLDNCSKENKNKYMMGYLEMLVAASVFERVECGFLPVGHTHEDVDQAFSATSGRLRVTEAITLADLQDVLRSTYGGKAQVQHLKRVANWSGLCEQERCLRRFEKITQWRYFLFVGEDSQQGTKGRAMRRTTCYVRKDCEGEWGKLFPTAKADQPGGILRHCPDLSKTPDTKIDCPDGLHEVNKRIWSEEERVNDQDKMIELNDLRDFVFRSRLDPFHWDLSRSVEAEHIGVNRTSADANGIDGQQYEDEDEIHLIIENSNEPNVRADDEDGNQVHDSGNDHTPNNREGEEEDDIISHADGVGNDGSEAEKSKRRTTAPTNKVDYRPGSYVIVRHSSASSSPDDIWVAKVLDSAKDGKSSYATSLKVHWYDYEQNDRHPIDVLSAKYHPCYQAPTRKMSRSTQSSRKSRQEIQVPWTDVIHTDTVSVSFDSLTKRHTLPLAVQKKLAR